MSKGSRIRENNESKASKEPRNSFSAKKKSFNNINLFLLKLNLAIAIFLLFSTFASSVSVEINQVALNLSYAGNINMNSGALFVDATNNRVGIGTTSPAAKLHVMNGAAQGSAVPTTAGILISGTTAANRVMIADGNKTIYMGVWGTFGELSTFDYTTSTALDLILNNNGGNVGIGTANPTVKLHVIGTLNVTNITLGVNCADGQILKWSGGVGKCGTDNSGAAGGEWAISGNYLYNTTANVGIGTATPGQKLEVIGNTNITGTLTVGGVQYAPIPSGMIAMFDAACPPGWTRVAVFDGRFVRGNAAYGGTGGSDTHTHAVGTYGTSTAADHTHGPGSYATNTAGVHTHGPGSYGTNYVGDHIHQQQGGAIEGGPGLGWPAAEDNWDTTGGGGHSHSVNTGNSGDSVSHSHSVNSGNSGAAGSHSHTITGTSGSTSNVPAYIDVIFCRKN